MTSTYVLQSPLSPPTCSTSLLRPTNPAFDDSAPSGGILINRRRPSDLSIDTGIAEMNGGMGIGLGGGMPTSAPSSMGRSEQMDSAMPSMKRSPLERSGGSDGILQPPLPSPPGLSGRQPDASAVPHPIKIRFAPLPSPQRQRSLSTGRNINMEATMTSDGTRIAKLAKRIPGKDGEWDGDPYDEHAIDDEDEEEEESVKRSWRNMGMGNWSRTSTGSISGATSSYTMRLLKPLISPLGNDAEPMDKAMMAKALEGAPLKKSVSTGGLIGSSPFRSSAEKARKSSFRSGGTSGSSSRGSGQSGHRASSSFETPDFSSLSSSLGGQQSYKSESPSGSFNSSVPTARPVKMLNGRVYGKRAADEAAARRMSSEPAFVEWGGMMGEKNVGGMGSNQTQQTIRTDRSEGGGGGMGSNSIVDDEDDGSGIAWVRKRREARERLRRESEAEEARQANLAAASTRIDVSPRGSSTADTLDVPTINVAPPPKHGEDHLVQAVFVPGAKEDELPESASGLPKFAPYDNDSEESSDSSDGYEEDDQNEYSDDDEEDLIGEEEAKRTTSSAAGVEVMVQRKVAAV